MRTQSNIIEHGGGGSPTRNSPIHFSHNCSPARTIIRSTKHQTWSNYLVNHHLSYQLKNPNRTTKYILDMIHQSKAYCSCHCSSYILKISRHNKTTDSNGDISSKSTLTKPWFSLNPKGLWFDKTFSLRQTESTGSQKLFTSKTSNSITHVAAIKPRPRIIKSDKVLLNKQTQNKLSFHLITNYCRRFIYIVVKFFSTIIFKRGKTWRNITYSPSIPLNQHNSENKISTIAINVRQHEARNRRKHKISF